MRTDSVGRALLLAAGAGLAAVAVLTAVAYAAGVRGMGLVVPPLVVAFVACLIPVAVGQRDGRPGNGAGGTDDAPGPGMTGG